MKGEEDKNRIPEEMQARVGWPEHLADIFNSADSGMLDRKLSESAKSASSHTAHGRIIIGWLQRHRRNDALLLVTYSFWSTTMLAGKNKVKFTLLACCGATVPL